MKSRQILTSLLSLAFVLSATPVPAAELSAVTPAPQTPSMTPANFAAAEGNAQANVNAKNAHLDEVQAPQAVATVPIQFVAFNGGGSSYLRITFNANESFDTFNLQIGGNGGGSIYEVNRIDPSITYRHAPSPPGYVTVRPGDAKYDEVYGNVLKDLLLASGTVWNPYYVNDGITDSATLKAAKVKTQQLYLLMAGLPKETRDKRGRVIASESYDFAAGLTIKSTYEYGAGNKVIKSTTEKYRGDVLDSKQVVRHTLGGTHNWSGYYQNGKLYLVTKSFVLRNGVKLSSLTVYVDPVTTHRLYAVREIFRPITGKIQKTIATTYDSTGRPSQKIIKTFNSKGVVVKERTVNIPIL